jgi:hypothetical protein
MFHQNINIIAITIGHESLSSSSNFLSSQRYGRSSRVSLTKMFRFLQSLMRLKCAGNRIIQKKESRRSFHSLSLFHDSSPFFLNIVGVTRSSSIIVIVNFGNLRVLGFDFKFNEI